MAQMRLLCCRCVCLSCDLADDLRHGPPGCTIRHLQTRLLNLMRLFSPAHLHTSPAQDGTVVALEQPDIGSVARFAVQLQHGVLPGHTEAGSVTVRMRASDVQVPSSDQTASTHGCKVQQGEPLPLEVRPVQLAAPHCRFALP